MRLSFFILIHVCIYISMTCINTAANRTWRNCVHFALSGLFDFNLCQFF